MLKNNKVRLVILSSLLVCMIYPKMAIAKPISNTLKATISVVSTSISVGAGSEFDYNEINDGISKVKVGGVVKIKSGQYNIDSILSKDVTLESYDGGYVDIITKTAIPQDTKLKIGNKVTVNQEGVAPISLVSGLIESGTTVTLSDNEIKVNAQQGDTVNIKLNQQIVNKLGFNNSSVMLRVSKTNGVKVDTVCNGTRNNIIAEGDGTYNLGKVEALTNNMIVSINFTGGGDYNMELWVDDGR